MDMIVTPRLLLRSPVAGDLQDLHEHVLSDPAVMQLAFSGASSSLEQSETFVRKTFDFEQTGQKPGVLTERHSGRVIGFAGLMACGALGQADYELGFVLRRDVWGRGYATEIGRAQIGYGFESLHLNRVLAQASPQNHASIAALKKIGMVFHSVVHSEDRGERLVYTVCRPVPG